MSKAPPAIVIATTELRLVRAGVAAPIAIVVRVGMPYARPTGEWACATQLEGVEDTWREICGADSMQAFGLALRFVRLRLGHQLGDGAQLFWMGEADPDDPSAGRIDAATLDAIFGTSPLA